MKTLLIAAAAAAVLVVAPAAEAAVYEGKLKGAPSSTFEFKMSNEGGTRVVRNFEVFMIPMTCDSGNMVYGFQGNASANVHADRSFKIRQDFGKSTSTKIRGAFNGTFEKATGTLRSRTTHVMFGECRSGKLGWRATRAD